MHLAAGLVVIVAVASVVAATARRFRVSEPFALTIVGILGSYIPSIPEVTISPELVLVGFLPPLIYTSSIRTALIDFRTNRRAIGLLSVGLVLFTAFGVGLVAWAMLPIPFAAAVALGAIVAPPDAVAATAIARRIGMPRRLVTILEGESLFNDATAIVTLRTAIAAIGGTVSALSTVGRFAWAVGGGVLIGAVMAYALGMCRRHITDPVLDTTLSFVAPFAAYLPAEASHASGILAVVVAGLILGHNAPQWQSASSRVAERVNWRTIEFVLENSVFLLIGLQVRHIVTDAWNSGVSHATVVGVCAAVLGTVIVLRPIWVFPATYLPRRVKAVRRADPAPPWQYPAIISWAGMRGVVTLAAALILKGNTPFQALLILVALVVVGGTLLVQGTTLPWLVRKLGVRGPTRAEDALAKAGLIEQAVSAGLRRLDELSGPDIPKDVVETLRERALERSYKAWERLGPDESELLTPSEATRRLRVAMIDAERDEVLRVRDRGQVDSAVVGAVLSALDLEEAMIERIAEQTRAEDDVDELVPANTEECVHLMVAPRTAEPDTPGICQTCIDENLVWVHLRMCLICGHVACCDSSPGRHATRHYHDTSHPVMRSVEPGEAWRWCYVDERLA